MMMIILINIMLKLSFILGLRLGVINLNNGIIFKNLSKESFC